LTRAGGDGGAVQLRLSGTPSSEPLGRRQLVYTRGDNRRTRNVGTPSTPGEEAKIDCLDPAIGGEGGNTDNRPDIDVACREHQRHERRDHTASRRDPPQRDDRRQRRRRIIATIIAVQVPAKNENDPGYTGTAELGVFTFSFVYGSTSR
jgi:hypothetical protein